MSPLSKEFYSVSSGVMALFENKTARSWLVVAVHMVDWESMKAKQHFFFLQVSLWKESLEGQWVCVSDVYKGQGQEPQWCHSDVT